MDHFVRLLATGTPLPQPQSVLLGPAPRGLSMGRSPPTWNWQRSPATQSAAREPFPLPFASSRLLLDPLGRGAFAVVTAPWPFLTEAPPTVLRAADSSAARYQLC